ncbi:MAG: putative ABC transporter permease [archaeon]
MIIKLALIFAIFAVLGWIGEIFYRNIPRKEKFLNPGFLKGPYLPIYGFAAVIVYFISLVNINTWLLIALSAFAFTFVELVTGLFFKRLNIILWDYSKDKFNYKGIICLKIVIIWIVIAAVWILWIAPIFHEMTVIPGLVIHILEVFYVIVIIDIFMTLKKHRK